MKRVLKTVGFLAALAAVVWAMRDRWISIEAPREDEPPVFRVPNGVPPSVE